MSAPQTLDEILEQYREQCESLALNLEYEEWTPEEERSEWGHIKAKAREVIEEIIRRKELEARIDELDAQNWYIMDNHNPQDWKPYKTLMDRAYRIMEQYRDEMPSSRPASSKMEPTAEDQQ